MTRPDVLQMPLPDQAARDRIALDLETNLLVEAGAGSGKTTALVARMVALVRAGGAVEQIAAVTFTRKAAGELSQRFQMKLEEALRDARAGGNDDDAVRLATALEHVDRAFVGTIHSFCARLLRERPLEIGLDPSFDELPVEERDGLRRRFWEAYLERLTRDSDPILEELARAGIRPALLTRAFEHLVENPDVHFPAEAADPPTNAELQPVREELEGIVDAGWELMPEHEPKPEWDSLQKKIRELHFTRDVTGWREPADLFEAIAALCKRGKHGHRVVLKRWRQPDWAKQIRGRADAFGHGDTPARRLLDRWYTYRYALAIRLVRNAAAEFAAHRRRIGRLDFQDLLVLTAELLRKNPEVRRQLGARYGRILVDEFQDTDPLQAEIVLLLSSEPGENGEGDDDWRTAVPRPGALFVVGDPKQSIYRFRRADIQLYNLVKERFGDFGAVLELTSNFRSRPPIGDLVNEHFRGDDFFPEVASAQQAAFEPLNTRPAPAPAVGEGVFYYRLAPVSDTRRAAAQDDAARIGSWIRRRIDEGERTPGDFLILTRVRSQLSVYARQLEAHGLPVQVTGAGVGAEEEIEELQVLLECLIDPSNPVKVVAALVGLFFGLDYERLLAHRLAGGGFDVVRPGGHGEPAVLEALRTLHGWWRTTITAPSDVFVFRLVDELGLLPYAAAGDLGALRAGALVYALDSVRAAALGGDASLPGALDALRAALALAEAEAPLEPGRPDVVRLMNLHQAKGLEATVVILADPTGSSERAPDFHTVRRADGSALGFIKVSEARSGWRGDSVLAAPDGWEEKEAAELLFSAAEEVRLTYVAVTRAKDELVVARWDGGRTSSPWASLDAWLDERAIDLDLPRGESTPREALRLTAEEAAEAAEAASARVASMAEPGFEHVTVTEVAKATSGTRRDPGESPATTGARYRGLSWGAAVHGALAAAASVDVTSEGLRATCRDLLVEQGRPLDDHGEPTELGELLELVRSVRASELWVRAQAAQQQLVEVPFAQPGVALEEPTAEESVEEEVEGERRQLDLFAGVDAGARPHTALEREPPRPGHPRVLEGVIDLAFRESDGWVIADYKTDVGTDPDFERRKHAYRRQVELYAEAWAALTGDNVKERVLFFTAQGRVERW